MSCFSFVLVVALVVVVVTVVVVVDGILCLVNDVIRDISGGGAMR